MVRNNWNQKHCESLKEFNAAGMRMAHRAKVAQCKGNIVGKGGDSGATTM
jgi:hypothetical protein